MDVDHLVFAGPDLAEAVDLVAELTGVRPRLGGRHVRFGTANYLLGLGDRGYLEIIGPDPDASGHRGPKPFRIDELTKPRLVNWAIPRTDLERTVQQAVASGYDPGLPESLSRRTPDGALLQWRLTPFRPDDGGLVPFLIDWADTTHPSEGLPIVRLRSLHGVHPSPERPRKALYALGVELDVVTGNRGGLVATVDGQHGPVVLS